MTLEPVVSGLTDPIGITNAGDGSGRLFVNERGGRIRVVDADGSLSERVFVDLSGSLEAGGERGLLGVAFHPDFAANGRVFVHYSRRGDGATVISELTASADRSTANPASERIILTHEQPFANHNGGQIAFGPDGYLYIGLGDGGSGGDPFMNAQARDVLLGKLLRIDVDGPPAPNKEYAIPADNPYAGDGVSPDAGLPEIWARGLRNPWRFSFDRATGELYIGDVGQNAWEEIDRQPAGSVGGENYGWHLFEGTHCSSGCDIAVVAPVAQYGHDVGCSVSGGYVYRGTAQPALVGTYLFSDYCAGTIWTLAAGGGLTPLPLAESGLRVSSFGEGEDGEIYLVDIFGGGLYRVLADH
ncbi:MAG TPA: PQQ-dependent sugar dehydrogenase [Candidatus Limnocylindria bacterium]|nr:PQQ-dependent sugar dehydrogenase [Candidatus Limnocylindria bacterium]